ncbi:Glycosyltransferase, catalytic subunit of cellulose synthase and poly-beta-1,6-N-acetylglucosamine synthase [Cnuella takakiae]|uniref:Glycosyltransferase, catalytic subunit of cellulose synthase and poly-beta-1,6-N-acetylglucosamine synthase n=1 Tax=Cnuella takakiae TaxID=1302690 RepID=A0A1M5CLG5_9BACT|nr:glycosyltransferase [Cnuella takakiae]OLY91861.1 hypothetical protein BUE76_08075 [Cnuella takakiae]SHF55272.1 Glycosyltransferase, catalytic subunit of cellulose synthase and poly-beta-1,6-N-acetylglucosamine synthase [Cnuella takakiae]
MNLLEGFWAVVQVTIGYNLVLPLLLYILAKVKTNKKHNQVQSTEEADYAIIVTAYQQTELLHTVVNSILQLNYSNYLVYIVADNCDISDLHFDNEKIILLKPDWVLASNTRSHFYAINRFVRPHQRLTIIDSDNLVDPEFINQLNLLFDQGLRAVQGIRKAKNLNTTFACLDAARDIFYHYYDGKLLYQLGSSATLAGSGMAFDVALYQECLGQMDIVGAGFDKVLQYEIVKRGYRIGYAAGAIVYDEKTSKSDQLVKQRARWINTWFKYFVLGFSLITKGISHRSWNQLLFGLILLRPPLFIFLLLSLGCILINWLIGYSILPWFLGMMIFAAGFYLSLSSSNTDRRIYKALSSIPLFVFYQIKSLTKVFSANKLSVATTHIIEENNK